MSDQERREKAANERAPRHRGTGAYTKQFIKAFLDGCEYESKHGAEETNARVAVLELLDEVERLNAVSNDLAHETMDLSAKISDAREVIGVLSEALSEIAYGMLTEKGIANRIDELTARQALESTREKREKLK